MTLEKTDLAKSRLRLGIANVGAWVLSACAGLFWLRGAEAGVPGLGTFTLISMVAIFVQAGFDFIGGAVLISVPRPSYVSFALRWVQGVGGHSFVLLCVALLHWISFAVTGGFCLAVLLSSIGLAVARTSLLRIIGGVQINSGFHGCGDVMIAKASDAAFTGGVLDLTRGAKSMMPEHWLWNLPEEALDVESARREWQIEHGLAVKAFGFVLLWNLLGASIGPAVFDFGARTPTAAIFGQACWMTLWAFFSLLTLPSLSRGVVFAADHAAVAAGRDPRGWIAIFPNLVAEDGSDNAIAQTIFYPVPSTAMRLQRLGQSPPKVVFGNLSRSYLYYSWSTFTLLGRTVHCNVGRPELWVFPPAA